mmetsp:Transcript_52815/g.113096  ORF Transcript_52815/g.113096 Transcript_52815/m.113096 type:complete len:340 (+) Transcript_52815:533-1552(+)
MGLGLFAWEGALAGEGALPDHRCGARDAVLEHQGGPHQQGMHGRVSTGRLRRISPLHHYITLLPLHGLERLAPTVGVEGQALIANTDDPAAKVLRRTVHHKDLVFFLLERDLLALPGGLVAMVFAPDNRHHSSILFLSHFLHGADPRLRPKLSGAAAHDRDCWILLHVPELLHNAIGLRKVICIDARDEVALALRPTLTERPRYTHLLGVVDDANVRTRLGEAFDDLQGGILGGVVDEDHLVGVLGEARLRLDGLQAIEDEALCISNRHEPGDQRPRRNRHCRQATGRRVDRHTHRGKVVAAVALGLQDALQDLRLWRLIIHAIKVLGDLLHLPTQLSR